MKKLFMCAGVAAAVTGCVPDKKVVDENATIKVYPEVTRSVKGVSELDRKRYFAICDGGKWFESNLKDKEMYDYLVNELGIQFGRELGPVNGVVKWDKSVFEDPKRPGFADIEKLKADLVKKQPKFSEQFKKDFGPNLDVAAHDNHNAYPAFMGKHTTEWSLKQGNHGHGEYLPKNLDAAAELAATIMKYGFTDFTRPAYFEPLNEPHWSFHQEQHIADWHIKTKEAVQKLSPEVKVGGYCSSVSYFFDDNYRVWWPYEKFMDNTKGKLDFYSFHTYDYFNYENGAIKGRIQSGLALESTLDMVAGATKNKFGKEYPIVISEHGGYMAKVGDKDRYDGEFGATKLAETHFPKATFKGDAFDWEMKKRSIVDFVHVSSILTNTMSFFDHPHTVVKAVPFILSNTWNWDNKYYANLFVPYNYEDKTRWVPTQMGNFYKFFRGVKGRRVKLLNADPDLQTAAFVDGNKLYVVINNMSSRPEEFTLSGIFSDKLSVRRMGRDKDYTFFYKEETIKDVSKMMENNSAKLTLAGREATLIIAEYENGIAQESSVNEIPFYSKKRGVLVRDGKAAEFTVDVDTTKKIDYAMMRVAVTQKFGDGTGITITLNGKEVKAPLEDCADRMLDTRTSKKSKNDFASMKIIRINPADLQASNKITVSFPNDKKKNGAVGSVVIRAAYAQ